MRLRDPTNAKTKPWKELQWWKQRSNDEADKFIIGVLLSWSRCGSLRVPAGPWGDILWILSDFSQSAPSDWPVIPPHSKPTCWKCQVIIISHISKLLWNCLKLNVGRWKQKWVYFNICTDVGSFLRHIRCRCVNDFCLQVQKKNIFIIIFLWSSHVF